jgi:hypothetical protein
MKILNHTKLAYHGGLFFLICVLQRFIVGLELLQFFLN